MTQHKRLRSAKQRRVATRATDPKSLKEKGPKSTPPSTTAMIVSRSSVNTVMHPRGSYIVIPIAVSGVATPENKVTHWRCHSYARKVGRKDAVHPSCDSPNTSRGFALGASNEWLVGENRRAPSRHSRDARVYDHSTTAMHKLSTPPSAPPPQYHSRDPPEVACGVLFVVFCSGGDWSPRLR